MKSTPILAGTVHQDIPVEITSLLFDNQSLLDIWQSLTPLTRNEWICFVISAKKQETKNRRAYILTQKLASGEHRPCCWPGCPHREKEGK